MIYKIRIADLPIAKTLKGLFTVGVDSNNSDVKVDLGFVEEAAETANAAAATANQAAQNADTARENIAGDLAQKSSMFTGAKIGSLGCFKSTHQAMLLQDQPMTIIVCFYITGNGTCIVYDEAQNTGGMYIYSSNNQVIMSVRGAGVSSKNITNRLCVAAISYNQNGSVIGMINGDISSKSLEYKYPYSPSNARFGGWSSSYGRFNIISARRFDFAMTEEQLKEAWNNGRPELWRVPDKYRNAQEGQRCFLDLIPESLTPTVWKDISGQGNDIPYVPFDSNPAECEMAYENMGFEDPMIRTVPPSVAPNFAGQRYIDMTNKAAYTAFGTSSASDWK